MEHTPYGYEIKDGRAVIKEEEAAVLQQICENYLSGMSFERAAMSAGRPMAHSGVRKMIQNPRYLGDDYYPKILTNEIVQRVEEERVRREKALGRGGRKAKGPPAGVVYTSFSSPKIRQKYTEPVRQAEYAYSLIRSEG